MNELTDQYFGNDHAELKQEIKDALHSLSHYVPYERLKKTTKIATQLDDLTNELIDTLFDDDGSITNRDNFLRFLTHSEPSKQSDVLSTEAFDHFITDFFLDDCNEKHILFPYMQSGFLPFAHALNIHSRG